MKKSHSVIRLYRRNPKKPIKGNRWHFPIIIWPVMNPSSCLKMDTDDWENEPGYFEIILYCIESITRKSFLIKGNQLLALKNKQTEICAYDQCDGFSVEVNATLSKYSLFICNMVRESSWESPAKQARSVS